MDILVILQQQQVLDDEGFFQTGDIAYIDDNELLFIKDRKKIVSNLFYFDSILFSLELELELEECLHNNLGISSYVLAFILSNHYRKQAMVNWYAEKLRK